MLRNIIDPTEAFVQFINWLVSLFVPVVLLLPVSMRYNISSSASLCFGPYSASILLRFFSEKIEFLFSTHCSKYLALLTLLLILLRSAVMFSTNQFSVGFIQPSFCFDILPKASEYAINSGLLCITSWSILKSFLLNPGTSWPALVHLSTLIAASWVNLVPGTFLLNNFLGPGINFLKAK